MLVKNVNDAASALVLTDAKWAEKRGIPATAPSVSETKS
jgi:hypothetical protein